jgi:hypothetical protein
MKNYYIIYNIMPKHHVNIERISCIDCLHENTETIINPPESIHYGAVFCLACHKRMSYIPPPRHAGYIPRGPNKKKDDTVPKVKKEKCLHTELIVEPKKENTISSPNDRLVCATCGNFIRFALNADKMQKMKSARELIQSIFTRFSDRLTEIDSKVLTEILQIKKITIRERKVLVRICTYFDIISEYNTIYNK